MAKLQEILIGWGKSKQTNISTANTAAGIWRLGKLNSQIVNPRLNTENDAAELGKGNEFPLTVYKTSWDVVGQIEKYTSAEFAAWAMIFGLGKSTKTGTPPHYIYTCTPLDPLVDGLELPYFSYVEEIRPGASEVLDNIMIGCAIESWALSVKSGPGRVNSKLTVDFVGSGNHNNNSGIVMPAATAEKLLPSSSLACTINGVDYVTAKNLISLDATWKNNLKLDDGFYPGSGFLTGGDAASGAIRGRLETGTRECSLQFLARFVNGSLEITKLKALTEGTAVVTLQYDAENLLTLTFQRVIFAVAELGETDGVVTVQVTCTPLWHTTNGILTAVGRCEVDGIGAVE